MGWSQPARDGLPGCSPWDSAEGRRRAAHRPGGQSESTAGGPASDEYSAGWDGSGPGPAGVSTAAAAAAFRAAAVTKAEEAVAVSAHAAETAADCTVEVAAPARAATPAL